MVVFFFWPFPLSIFFAITGITLAILLISLFFVKERARSVISILINAVSVITFIGLVAFIAGGNLQCSPEITRTLVITVAFFVLLFMGVMYYNSQKRRK